MKPLYTLRTHKTTFYNNVYLMILLSIGISLIANTISHFFPEQWQNTGLLIFGICCIIYVIIIYIIDFYRHRSYKIQTEATFITDDNGNIVHIPFYPMGYEIKRILESVFRENRAYHKLWLKSFDKGSSRKGKKYSQNYVMISKVTIEDTDIHKYIKDDSGFCLVHDAIEYIFIDWLSTAQERYFSELKEDAKFDTLTRKDIPTFLLENKIINTISKPFEEREKFINQPGTSDSNEDIHFLQGEDGVIFQKFEIKLPQNSIIERKDNALIIKNRNYKIHLIVEFKGFNASLPNAFADLFIGKTNIIPYTVKIELKVELNPFFFLFAKDWRYLNWIDVMYDKFLDYFSFNNYIKNIGYSQALTNLIMYKNFFIINHRTKQSK